MSNRTKISAVPVTTNVIFSPTSIIGCVFWIDATDVNGTGTNAAYGNISSWKDKVSGITLTSSSANTLVANSTNSLPGVRWTYNAGNGYGMTSTINSSYAITSGPIMLVCVVKYNNQASFANWLLAVNSAQVYMRQYTNNYWLSTLSGGTWSSGTQLLTAIYDGTSSSFYVNGTLLFSGTLSTMQWTGIISIGSYWDGTTNNSMWSGDVNEMLVYSSTTNRQTVEAYLAQKWGLTASLPVGHPGLTTTLYGTTASTVPTTTTTVNFLPTSITGCQLWLDSADSTSIVQSGGIVSQWNDKSGNANNATQATLANRPTYSNNALVFAGSQWFQTPITSFPTAESIFIVFKTSTAVADIFSGTTTGSREVLLYTGTKIFLGYAGTDPSATTPNAGVIPLNTIILYDIQYTSSAVTFNVNGSTTGSGTPYFTFSGTGTSWIGSSAYSPNNMNGTIYELIYYNVSLLTSQRKIVEGYLAQKWGLTSSLPSGHPGLTTTFYGTTTVARNIPSVIFLPTSILSCALWLDGADPLGTGTPPSNGATVSSWADKSGNNITWTTVGTPTYNSTQYGRGGVIFNGSSYFQNTTFSFPLATRAIFIVANGSSSNTGLLAMTYTVIDYNNINTLVYTTNGSKSVILTEYYPTGFNATFTSSVEPVLISDSANGTSVSYYGNGSLVQTISFTPTTSTGIFIGARNDQGGVQTGASCKPMTGNINEVLLFNTTLTTTQRQTVEGYLAQKWGLTSSLPVGHPGLTTTLYGTRVLAKQKVAAIPKTIITNFLPTSITGCALWLDGVDATTVTGTTNVSQWNDKSGSSRNVTQSTSANQPTYSSTSNAMVFNGNQYLNIPNALAAITPSYTIFIVEKRASANIMFFLGQNGINSGNTALILGYNATNISHHTTAYVTDCQVTIPSYAGVSEPIRINRYDYSGTTRDTYINGGQYSNTQSFSNTLTVWSNANIGAGFASSTYSYIGNIYEVIFYNNVLTTTQSQTVESYLAQKWGLTSSLPVGHPGLTTTVYSATTVITRGKQKVVAIPKYVNFLPTSITGCSLWLDAADATAMTLSGTSVVTVLDKSGNGNTLSGGSGWTYNVTKFNSTYPSFYKATSSSMLGQNNTFSITSPNITLFFVGAVVSTATSSNQTYFVDGGSSGTNRFYNYTDYASGSVYSNKIIHGDSVTGATYQNTVSDFFTPFIFSQSTGTSPQTGSFNGTAITASAGTTGSITWNGITIGARYTNASDWWSGHICEMIVYTTSLSVAQRQTIESYLAQKWGLTSSLPVGHPGYVVFVYTA